MQESRLGTATGGSPRKSLKPSNDPIGSLVELDWKETYRFKSSVLSASSEQ